VSGFRKVWIKGERREVTGFDTNGRPITRRGKNGGPVIEQRVELHHVPKGRRA
jgi:hypothetical protein